MGTRADFYVGRDQGANWIGSIAWDGYTNGISAAVLRAETKTEYLDAVATFFNDRADVTNSELSYKNCTTYKTVRP